jgi:microsomal dipeptidase-like Zn-dependent dipeptidase
LVAGRAATRLSAMGRTKALGAAAAVLAAGAAATLGAKAGGRWAVARAERRLCVTDDSALGPVSDRARALHATLEIVDLHADSLLWGRNLGQRGWQGHVDLPRMREGNIALQVFGAPTHAPHGRRYEGNDGRADDMLLVVIGSAWPAATWRSRTARALFLAKRARRLEAESDGRFRLIRTRTDLAAYRKARASDPTLTAGLLSIEGAHALDDDLGNLDVLFSADFRMMSPSHFFDTAFGGSAHGVEMGGLTPDGRAMIEAMEARGMVVDVAHASEATIDDVLAIARRPIVSSHAGVRGTADNNRNLSDVQLRGIAASGGVVGIGFWEAATGGRDLGAIVRAIVHAVNVAGADHVGLGSDWDGAVAVPIDAAGMVHLTDALLDEGYDDATVARIMGGNAMRVLAETLP